MRERNAGRGGRGCTNCDYSIRYYSHSLPTLASASEELSPGADPAGGGVLPCSNCMTVLYKKHFSLLATNVLNTNSSEGQTAARSSRIQFAMQTALSSIGCSNDTPVNNIGHGIVKMPLPPYFPPGRAVAIKQPRAVQMAADGAGEVGQVRTYW